MAVADNAVPNIDSSIQNLESTVLPSESNVPNDVETLNPRNDPAVLTVESDFQSNGKDQNLPGKVDQPDKPVARPATISIPPNNYKAQMGQVQNGFETNGVKNQQMIVKFRGGYGINQMTSGVINGEDGGDSFKQDMRDLEELLSKLNPMAKEFIPPSLTKIHQGYFGEGGFGYTNNFTGQTDTGNTNGHNNRRKKNGFSQGRRRMNYKMSAAKRDEMVRRTVYVSDIDQQVTEERLASVFVSCGHVVDCRICGDPNSILRFAFIEFLNEEGARAALNLSGTVLGFYPVRVLPSKTAIAPVNPELLPRSENEREMCARTIYCTNIDKKITQADVKLFFETLCGEVHRLRLLGDYHHFTRIAFVEFTMAESAIAALNCSGVILGSLPIRVSPSKTPVQSRSPRSQLQ